MEDKSQLFPLYLQEALPYIQEFNGRCMVIKYGGAAMVDPEQGRDFLRDVVLLHYVGIRPILVHGGGPEISGMMKRLGKQPEFIGGLRVTDAETVDIAAMVLLGVVNRRIVATLNHFGASAVGLSGKDAQLLRARKQEKVAIPGQSETVDLGFVGEVVEVRPKLLQTLEEGGFIPVVAPLGLGDDGTSYNLNADTVAGAIAAALHADRLILLTDTIGILRDRNNADSTIPTIQNAEIEQLIAEGTISGGMLPKVQSARTALAGGVQKVHILDGRVPHCLLLELFTDRGVGTEIVK